MSNERNINELMSAYFDGEATADERARVEQFLEESIEARQELDQFGSLSESLKSLPSDPAPQELLPSVMRRAEREALLSISEHAAVRSSGRKSAWLTIIAGVVVTAASVMLVVQFLPDETSELSLTVADNDSSSQPTDGNESLALREADDSSAPATARESTAEGDARWRFENTKMGGSKESLGAPLTESNPVAKKLDVMPLKTMRGAGSSSITKLPADSRRLNKRRKAVVTNPGAPKFAGGGAASADAAPAVNLDTLKRARRGDVIQYFDSSGTKVTTYLVTVVDVKQAMDKMQVLLARNDIPPLQANTRIDNQASNLDLDAHTDNENADKKGKSQDEMEVETDRLFAVYIETTSSRFRLALKDLLNEELFADLSTKPPVDEVQIQVADAGRVSRRLFDRQVSEAKLTKDIRGLDAPASRNSAALPALENAPTAGKKKPKPDAAKPSTDAKAELPKQPSGFDRVEKANRKKRLAVSNRSASQVSRRQSSFQLQVQLAPHDANADPQRTTRTKQLKSRDKISKIPGPAKKQALDDGWHKLAVKDHQSAVRVLFVFREAPRKLPKK